MAHHLDGLVSEPRAHFARGLDNAVERLRRDVLKLAERQLPPAQDASQSFSRFVGLQRAILVYVYELCVRERSFMTPPIFNREVAQMFGASEETVKNAFKRLCAAGALSRSEYKVGRGGWSTYELQRSLHEQIRIAQQRLVKA